MVGENDRPQAVFPPTRGKKLSEWKPTENRKVCVRLKSQGRNHAENISAWVGFLYLSKTKAQKRNEALTYDHTIDLVQLYECECTISA